MQSEKYSVFSLANEIIYCLVRFITCKTQDDSVSILLIFVLKTDNYSQAFTKAHV